MGSLTELAPRPPRRGGSPRFRLKGWLLLVLFLLVLPVATFGGGIFYLSRGLPAIEGLWSYQPSLVTRVYSDDNRLIGQFFVERRIKVPLSRIPKHLIQAVVAVEDSRFYSHNGIDLIGITRAAVRNITSLGIRQGASTVTQQLARSLFLTPERSIERKLKEMILALRIERAFTKDQIMEMYLNQIYFGHGAYGIQAAARTYFGKDVSALTLPEAAFLAGLPKAPRDYSPYFSPQRAKRRQGIVLGRMLEEGFITEAEYRQAYEEDLYFRRLEKGEEIAPYFVEYVRQYLLAKYGDEKVYRGGLNVYTTLNVELQRAADRAVRVGLFKLDKRQGYRGPIAHQAPEEDAGALREDRQAGGSVATGLPDPGDLIEAVVSRVEPDAIRVDASGITGKIPVQDLLWARRQVDPDSPDRPRMLPEAGPHDLFRVGDVILVALKGRDPETQEVLFTLEQEPRVEAALLAIDPRSGDIKAMVGGYDFKRSEFNRAVLARRQPGSAFKPIIYGAAIEKGFTPSTILMDSPVIFTDPVSQKVWKPTNYERRFYGPISLRDALTFSRNVATIRLLNQVGIQKVIGFSRRLGIESPLSPDLSLALGSSGVSLLELVSAYGVFANQGVRAKPNMIRLVTDSEQNVLEYHEPELERVLKPEVAYVLTNILQDVIQRGTGRRARSLGPHVAGKTGTTNDFTDAWFVGFTPNLAAGVWVGFDDRRSLGNREAGSVAALPIWTDFMREALQQIPPMTFPIPDDVVFARIDPATGLLAGEGHPGSRVEIFVRGHEPRPAPPPRPSAIDFYRMDQAPAGESL